jgi:hypothetical protein
MSKLDKNIMISSITTITAAVTTVQAMNYSIVVVLALITLLAIKEILSSRTNDKRVKSFIKGSNVLIIPLLLVFISIVSFKVVSVL